MPRNMHCLVRSSCSSSDNQQSFIPLLLRASAELRLQTTAGHRFGDTEPARQVHRSFLVQRPQAEAQASVHIG